MPSSRRTKRGKPGPTESAKERARAAIAAYLDSLDSVRESDERSGPRPIWHQPRPDQWTISMIGSAQQTLNLELALGEYTLQLMAFYMRKPDENVGAVYRLLLRRNLELSTVKFGIDEFGDIYLRADLPVVGVTEQELDRAIGIFYSCADSNYLPIIRLGFTSASRPQTPSKRE